MHIFNHVPQRELARSKEESFNSDIIGQYRHINETQLGNNRQEPVLFSCDKQMV